MRGCIVKSEGAREKYAWYFDKGTKYRCSNREDTLLFLGQDRHRLNPLPEDKILDRSKLKQSADDSFKFDENSRKFSKRVENTVGKEETARYEQFLLYPQCFQKACLPRASKGVIVWEWVKDENVLSTSNALFRLISCLKYSTHDGVVQEKPEIQCKKKY